MHADEKLAAGTAAICSAHLLHLLVRQQARCPFSGDRKGQSHRRRRYGSALGPQAGTFRPDGAWAHTILHHNYSSAITGITGSPSDVSSFGAQHPGSNSWSESPSAAFPKESLRPCTNSSGSGSHSMQERVAAG